MRPGGNLCPSARQRGVALLHGNCQVSPRFAFLSTHIANLPLSLVLKAFSGADAVLTAVFKFWTEQVESENKSILLN